MKRGTICPDRKTCRSCTLLISRFYTLFPKLFYYKLSFQRCSYTYRYRYVYRYHIKMFFTSNCSLLSHCHSYWCLNAFQAERRQLRDFFQLQVFFEVIHLPQHFLHFRFHWNLRYNSSSPFLKFSFRYFDDLHLNRQCNLEQQSQIAIHRSVATPAYSLQS